MRVGLVSRASGALYSKFTILLDQENAGMDFSLRAFCQNIYRTSKLTGEAIVYEMVNNRE